MSGPRTQTSFTAGEIDPLLAGRLDIRAAGEGCRQLRNVFVLASGGVTRRPGTRLVRELSAASRLVAVDLPAGQALIALGGASVQILENETAFVTLTAPWTATQAGRLRWTRWGTGLLICHPEVEPQELVRDAAGLWTIRSLAFAQTLTGDGLALVHKPFHRFATADASIQATLGSQPLADAIPANRLVTVRTNKPVFGVMHLNTRLRIRGRQLTITNIINTTQVAARTDQPLVDGQATYDWQEETFSAAHGWPSCAAIHQNRLVLGGTRDLPNGLWMSRSGRQLDFDTGTGLDDEAIAFTIAGNGRHDILAIVPNRQLQVLTAAGEWIIRGTPLTPTSVQAELQTSIGSQAEPMVPPQPIDGATLFIGNTGRELREFLYTDAEQAYQAADLAVLCRHLLAAPVDMAFDPSRRLLAIVRADGRFATVTLDRTSNIAAWSLQEVAGVCRAAVHAGGRLYLIVEFNGRVLLECLDAPHFLDHAVRRQSATPTQTWTGFGPLVGQPVVILADGQPVAEQVLNSATISLAQPAREVVCGVRYAHRVEALPLSATGNAGTALDSLYRLVRATFRLDGTERVTVDLGNGPQTVTAGVDNTLGTTRDLTLRSLGWRRALTSPPWRIEQSDAAPFTLLATTLELKVNV